MRLSILAAILAGCASSPPAPKPTEPVQAPAVASVPAPSAVPSTSAAPAPMTIDDATVTSSAEHAIVRIESAVESTKSAPGVPPPKPYLLVSWAIVPTALNNSEARETYRMSTERPLAKDHTYVVFYRKGSPGKALATWIEIVALQEIEPAKADEYGAAYAKRLAK